jgi:hypothetical protein
MACAEPSWANALATPQLIGLLHLWLAFCGVAYFSDVHLGDNVMFFDSFGHPQSNRLYRHTRELAERGLVKIMLRDASLRPSGQVPVVECESFSDVLKAWVTQDDESAWINPGVTRLRRAYFRDLDSWARGSIVERYSYGEVKASFMASVRRLGTLADEAGSKEFVLGSDCRSLVSDYAKVVGDDWFTLSDVYSVLNRNGVPPGSIPFLRHGLVNELAYGHAAGATLVGADDERHALEGMFWASTSDATPNPSAVSAEEVMLRLLERANAVLEAPDLSVLALLSADELLELIRLGRGYFDLARLAQDDAFVRANSDLTQRLLSELTTYWQRICDFIVERHPTAVTRPTRLGIFVGRIPGAFRRLGGSGLSLAFNIGTPAANLAAPGSGTALREAEEAVQRNVSFRFLFAAQSEELRRLRGLLPARGWVARQRASVIIPDP